MAAAPLIDPSIAQVLRRLRSLTQWDVRDRWRVHVGDLPVATATDPLAWEDWAIPPQDDRGYLMGDRGRQVRWLGQVITVPEALTADGWPLAGLRLRFALGWWSEDAQVYVNGRLVQAGDLFDCFCRVVLSEAVTVGESWTVAVRLVSPGHDDGALVRSRLIYEPTDFDPELLNPDASLDPGFVADELETVQRFLSAGIFPKFTLRSQDRAQADFNQKLDYLNWSTTDGDGVDQAMLVSSIQRIRLQLLQQGWSHCLKERTIEPVGHAHLDMVWLWPLAETYGVAEKTFESVLKLQSINADLTFCHSSPALLEWIEINRPDLFRRIQEAVKAGQFEIAAGLWIEPEFNLIGGEAIARQLLYGQRYVQEKFKDSRGESIATKIAWLPDSFGFCWQLPQFFKQAGIDYFLTQKLRWNDSTEFPHELFHWTAPDGTQILTVMMPPIGTDTDPIAMGQRAIAWETATGDRHPLWLPGVGDHGGGPSQDMLDVAHQWQRSPLFPEIQFKTGIDHCDRLEKRLIEADQLPALPEWKDELYLEFHRGCYTTHGDQKLANRTCENLLFEAELWLSLAGIQGLLTTEESQGHHDQLQAAWKKVLLNQFHDILPGSAVPEAYMDANQDWGFAEGTARSVLNAVMGRWGRAMVLDAKPSDDAIPYLVFNSVDGERVSSVEVVIPGAKPDVHWQVTDSRGELLQSQILCSRDDDGGDRSLLIALPPFVGIGYQVIYLQPGTATEDATGEELPEDTGLGQLNGVAIGSECQLSNDFVRMEIDPETGLIARLIDKSADGTVMTGPGPQLQLFKDDGQYWDAWNIDPEYETHRLADPKLVDIAWLEQGPLRQCLRTVFLWGDSTFEQDYILDATDPYVTVKTRVHWKERHVLLKMAIAVDEAWDQATYHIPGGAIARPTRPKTEAEKAKWEVPALQWADLSSPDQTGGLSILNDCKHGYDAKPGLLRLTLLRGATWPNPDADRGEHCFSYALYPHGGSWQDAGTMHHGDCFNRPLRAIAIVPDAPSVNSQIKAQPAAATLLSLGQPNLRLMTLKRSEDHSQSWILRCHESAGESASLANAKLGRQPLLNADAVQMTDLLEQPGSEVPETLTPWQIATFKFAQNCSKINSV